MQLWIFTGLNGLSFGMLLFLLSAGLSLVFGLMRVINLAQGSLYLLGAYIGLTVVQATGNFLLALVAGSIAAAIIGLFIQRFFLLRFYGITTEKSLSQVLITFGFMIAFSDVALWLWGGRPQMIPTPHLLQGSFTLGAMPFPKYRLLIIAVGLIIAGLLYWLQQKTRYGVMLRAAVDDEEMARGLGINVPRLFSAVFGVGALLAGFSGVLAGPFIGIYPGADFEVLLLALIVVVVGGMGSLKGAFVASILIGIVDNLSKRLFPEIAMFSLFMVMIAVLLLRPRGLFGRA